MRTRLLTLLLCCTLTLLSNAQPDLTLGITHLNTQNLIRGNYLSLDFQVKNIGTSISPTSHFSIYISPTTNFVASTAIKLSDISIEALAAGTSTQSINYIYAVPYNITNGSKYLIYGVDSRNEVNESNETNNFFYVSTVLNIQDNNSGGQQNLPYPIIMVHGLNSDNTAWYKFIDSAQSFYGFSYGGNMNFCLNQDENIYTSNKLTDYKDWSDESTLGKADFYTVNFKVKANGQAPSLAFGLDDIESNQSGIVKQGLAIRDAIKHVLTVTKKDKVILLGHSMGGLASREYLQDSTIWQADGKHHVAKLVTLGTPHGGSNSASFGLIGLANTLDEKSEAVRDLRYNYNDETQIGVYLFGGQESYDAIRYYLAPLYTYNNVDVNCNGNNGDGSNIVGLNQKKLPTDLDYSCVIGTESALLGDGYHGDGVVSAERANLNNFRNANADTFLCAQPSVSAALWHTELPKKIDFIIKALDEPRNKNQSFSIDTARYYFAQFTTQSLGNIGIVDSDYYKINIPQSGILNIELLNLPVVNAGLKLYNTSNSVLSSVTSNGKAFINANSIAVSAGTYYLNIYGLPDDKAWLFPYAFKTTFTAIPLPLQLLDFSSALIDKNGVLKWVTTDEINTGKFDVERSVDGMTWGYLGTVNALNVSGTNNYTYSDFSPLLGTNHYRLKMIDKDGNYTYSMVRDIVIESLQSAFTIMPNPAKEYALISFKQPFNGKILVFDTQGKKLFEDIINATNYNLSTSQFFNGNYIVKIINPSESYVQQLIIAK